MNQNRSRVPSYRHHRASGQAVVTLDGFDHYLGKFDSPESHAKYDRLAAQYLANGRRMPRVDPDQALTVGDMCMAFIRHAKEEYRLPDGRQSREVANVRIALRPLVEIYCDVPAQDFGPLDLKHYRDLLLEGDLVRTTINQRVQIVRRAFRWATAMEMIPPSVLQALQAVRGLNRGRCLARDTEPVRPVPEKDIHAAMSCMPPVIKAMVELQWLTGARPGEIVILRACDIDMSKDVWLYRPEAHKNSWRGMERVIPIGPRAQSVLSPLLRPGLQEQYLFSPHKPCHKRKCRAHAAGGLRDHYDSTTYAQAVRRACERAGIAAWTPGRLRHNRATSTEESFGIEGAAAILGHKRVETTRIYSEAQQTVAIRIAREIG